MFAECGKIFSDYWQFSGRGLQYMLTVCQNLLTWCPISILAKFGIQFSSCEISFTPPEISLQDM